MTIQEILNDVFDSATNKLRLEIGVSSGANYMTVEELLNAIYNPTTHSLIVNI